MSKYFSPEVNSFWYCCSCCQRKYFNALVSAWTMDRSKQIHSLICVFFCFFDLDSFSVYLFPYVMTFGHAIRIFFIIVFLIRVWMIKWRLLKVHSICNEFVEMHSHMTHKNCTSYINDLLQSTLENQLFHAAAQNFEWYLISFRVSLLPSLPLPYHFVQSLLPLVLVNQTHLLTQHIKILLDLHYHSCNYCQHL